MTEAIAAPDATVDTSRPCPVCNSQNRASVFDTICRCNDCGMNYVSRLELGSGEAEGESYFLNEYLPIHRANWQNSVAERRSHLSTIQRHFPVPSCPRLLDVGCALGLMLEVATDAGWEAVGVEVSTFAAQYAMKQTRCEVFAGTLQDAAFESGSFDVVTLMDVIEHVLEPRALINEIHRVLRPNGVLFVITPNFGSFFVRLFGRNAYGVGPKEHVNCFRPRTLKHLLLNSGFTSVIAGTKDLYSENIRRLLRVRDRKAQSEIKNAFGTKPHLRIARSLANLAFMHVPLGDKLIAFAQK